MACQSAISSLSSSSSAVLSFSAARPRCSSSAMASFFLPPSFQGLQISRARSLHPTPSRRAAASSCSSCRPLIVTAGELPLVGNEASDFEAEAVFDQEFVKVAFGTNILFKTAEAVWDVQGQSTLEQPRSNARTFASLDSDGGKADGARKALEQAFQGKNSAKKWEEEIRKREISGGDGGSGGGGGGSWGGGGGGGDEEMGEDFGQDEPWDWEEAGQTFMATFVLIVLYISITHGPKQVFKLFKLFIRYIRQGFRLRKIPDEYLQGSDDDSDEDYDSDLDDDARDDFIRNRRAELSITREGDVQKNNNDSVNEDDDDMFDAPPPPKQKSKREDLLSKRQAEQKEKLLQLLTPKERRQQEEKK